MARKKLADYQTKRDIDFTAILKKSLMAKDTRRKRAPARTAVK